MRMRRGGVVALLAVIGADTGRTQAPTRTRAIAPVVRDVAPDTRSLALDDASVQLTRVTAIVPRADGSFVVVDGRQRRLHFVTPEGRVTKTHGGNGQGPGEYRAVTAIDRLPSDSIVVLDGSLRRVTVLSPAGEVGRVFTLVPPFDSGGSPSTLVALGSGQLLIGFSEIRTMAPRPEAAYFTQRLFPYTTAGVVERGSAFSLPMSEHFVQAVPASMGGVAYWDRAFGRRTTLRALGRQVLVGDGSGWWVEAREATGAVVARHGVGRERAPVTPEDRAAYRRTVVTATDPNRRAIEERLGEEMPFPNEQPAYRQFLVSDDGDVWLESYVADPAAPVEWLRVPTARAGDAVRYRWPRGFRPLAIRGQRAFGVWRDADDVDHVHIYPVPRP